MNFLFVFLLCTVCLLLLKLYKEYFFKSISGSTLWFLNSFLLAGPFLKIWKMTCKRFNVVKFSAGSHGRGKWCWLLPASTHSLIHLSHSLCSDIRILISKHQAVFGLARVPFVQCKRCWMSDPHTEDRFWSILRSFLLVMMQCSLDRSFMISSFIYRWSFNARKSLQSL